MQDSSINKGEDARLVVFGYRQYNIVHYKGLYYGWPWPAGEFTLEGYRSGTAPAAVEGKSIMDVKNLIDKKLGSPTSNEVNMHDWDAEQEIEAIMTGHTNENKHSDIRLVVFGYRQYNIIYYSGLYFGWPWPAGEFSLEKYNSRAFLAAVVGKSVMNVKKLIDVKLGSPTVEEESQHDWTPVQQMEDVNAVVLDRIPIDVKIDPLSIKEEIQLSSIPVQQMEDVNIVPLIRKENVIKRITENGRFLLIKQWGFGFWSDMDDVRSKLLLAELTNRYPIVYWGKNSLFSVDDNCNSFEQYFLPVSDYSFDDVISDKYTYYPPTWNAFNLQTDLSKLSRMDPDGVSRVYKDIPNMMNSNANVLVSDVHNFMHEIMPYIKPGDPTYGFSEDEVHRYIFHKYIKLQPDIEAEIVEFHNTYMKPGPILAVHVRAGVKLTEDPNWGSVNAQYPHEIDSFLRNNPSARIFLLTDDEVVLKQYKQMYGNILIYTDCTRKTINDIELCLKTFSDKRRKGIEIIKDTYLACKCDYFVGYWMSNVSRTISQMKDWGNKIKLFR